MSKILHIKDAYFKIPDKAKDDFGCAITLMGIYLQQNNLSMDEMNKAFDNTDISDFIKDDGQRCLLSCTLEQMEEE